MLATREAYADGSTLTIKDDSEAMAVVELSAQVFDCQAVFACTRRSRQHPQMGHYNGHRLLTSPLSSTAISSRRPSGHFRTKCAGNRSSQ